MMNKNVCPNCGQLYDTNLTKCPLCGTAPQVVEATAPVQRKRNAEAERRRKWGARFQEDAEAEQQMEEEDARRREERRQARRARKDARRAEQARETAVVPNSVVPSFTPGPARDGRGPMPDEVIVRDRRRVPRPFLVLSAIILTAALAVGGSYLLWKLKVVSLPVYDKLAGRTSSETVASAPLHTEAADTTKAPPAATIHREEGEIPCVSITLNQTSIVFTTAGDQTQLSAELAPANTTDERRYASSDESVVRVSPVGIVTAVGSGEAVITVSCGEITALCSVLCNIAETAAPTLSPEITELVLNIKDNDMTFFAAGENYRLAVTNIPPEIPVEWKSLDESVCTVDATGHVVAVGAGTTRVLATVGNLEVYCWVRCRFD